MVVLQIVTMTAGAGMDENVRNFNISASRVHKITVISFSDVTNLATSQENPSWTWGPQI